MPAERCAAPESSLTENAASFAELGVPAALVDVLDADGITAPFPVQAATLPDALAGRDILGRARTGSGKTLGFSLPMVSRLAGGSTASGRPRGLVLVPTRELASQVTDVLKPLARAMGLWVTTIYGGVAYGPQVNALQRRTDIVVATPGRLADLIGQGECDLSDVEITVIDEADQMADLGFLPIVRRLLETTPDGGQRMLFSATLDAAIDVLARRFLSDPVLHSVDENSSPAEIEHHVLTVEAVNRVAVIAALAGGEKRSLVFTRTKHGAERLARQLTQAGIPAAELHGNLRQGARSRNLAAFASGIARVMVATDIAARGIHIDGIDLVIHADPPAEHKAYVHRSGRTARGGADGVVVTLQTKSQVRDVTALMRKADITPHAAVAADAESDVIAEIAGPPAPKVSVAGKVSELVQPEDRLARNDRTGAGKPADGRPPRRARDRKPRDDRFRDSGPRDSAARDFAAKGESAGRGDQGGNDWRPRSGQGGYRRPGAARPGASGRSFGPGNRADAGARPAYGDRGRDDRGRDDRNRDDRSGRDGWNRDDRNRDDRGRDDRNRDDRSRGYGYRDDRAPGADRRFRDERSGRDSRPAGNEPSYRGARQEQPFRDDRSFRDGRPARDERPGRDDRPFRGEGAARPRSGTSSQPAGQAFRPRAGRSGRPQAGGNFTGSPRRSEYSAGRAPRG